MMPAGVLVTVPEPVPPFATVIVGVFVNVAVSVGVIVNVAVTACAALIVTVQADVPLHPAPLQPANVDAELGFADSVTEVPFV